MIADQMTTGILDKDIQEDLFAKDKQLLNFQDQYDLIEAYGFGKLASPLDTEALHVRPMIAAHHVFTKLSNICQNMRSIPVNVFTDTRAQTCISDPDILQKLDIDEKFLLPTSHRMIGVTGKCVDIIGVVFLEMEHKGHISRNVVYICRTVKGFFVSAKAQTELGMLPLGYPNLDFCIMSPVTSTDTSSKLADCGCPKRELPSTTGQNTISPY